MTETRSPAEPRPTRSIVELLVTIALMVLSVVVAIVLFTASVFWALDPSPNRFGFVLGVYGPAIITVAGLVLGIIAIVRARRAFIYPLAAIVLSVIAWWLGGTLLVSG